MTSRKPIVRELETLGKRDLKALCDRLLADDPDAVENCISFIEAETLSIGHGRARAMMARRLKHCRLSQAHADRVVRAILDRLLSGRFSEQFKDQLRLVLQLAPQRAFKAGRTCQGDAAAHVRRYGAWILAHQSPAS